MNEQEAQKAAFNKWDDFNKNSLSIDYKNGHEQGWDDALEWVKQGQEPVLKKVWAAGVENGTTEFIFLDVEKEFETPVGTVFYTHPAPPPEVSELVEAAKKALESLNEIRELAAGFEEDNVFFEIADKALSKLEFWK